MNDFPNLPKNDHDALPAPVVASDRPSWTLDVYGLEEGDDDYDEDRTGFIVAANGRSWAKAYLGYAIENNQNETVDIEVDVLEVAYISTRLGRQDQGLGRALTEKLIAEGVNRVFRVGRAKIWNAKMVSILERLQTQGIIQDLALFWCQGDTDESTQNLLESPTNIANFDEAKQWLNEHVKDLTGDGFSEVYVHGIFTMIGPVPTLTSKRE